MEEAIKRYLPHYCLLQNVLLTFCCYFTSNNNASIGNPNRMNAEINPIAGPYRIALIELKNATLALLFNTIENQHTRNKTAIAFLIISFPFL